MGRGFRTNLRTEPEAERLTPSELPLVFYAKFKSAKPEIEEAFPPEGTPKNVDGLVGLTKVTVLASSRYVPNCTVVLFEREDKNGLGTSEATMQLNINSGVLILGIGRNRYSIQYLPSRIPERKRYLELAGLIKADLRVKMNPELCEAEKRLREATYPAKHARSADTGKIRSAVSNMRYLYQNIEKYLGFKEGGDERTQELVVDPEEFESRVHRFVQDLQSARRLTPDGNLVYHETHYGSYQTNEYQYTY